jgi:hypothetical protein
MTEETTVQTPTTITAFKASDGRIFEVESERDAHEAGLRYNKLVYAFIGAKGLKGRSKNYIADAVREFLVWNAARVAAEPAPAE